MDRLGHIGQICARLQGALETQNWELLDTCVRELAPQLGKLTAAGPWNNAERSALLQLREVHGRVASACASQMVHLQSKMDDMHQNQEGWMAYAMTEEQEQEQGITQG